MKNLKSGTKKNLMPFITIFLIAIFTLLILPNNVYAQNSSTININYDNIDITKLALIQSKLDEYMAYGNENYNNFIITFGYYDNDNTIFANLYDLSNVNINDVGLYSYYRYDYSSGLYLSNTTSKTYNLPNKYSYYNNQTNQNQNSTLTAFNFSVPNGTYTYDYLTSTHNRPMIVIYYSSFDLIRKGSLSGNWASYSPKINVNGVEFLENEKFITYYDYINASRIELTSNFANDLNGNELYIVNADFSEIYDNNYQYQYRLGDNNWINITNDIIAENSNHIYSLNIYANETINFRILDSNNNVIDSAQTEITSLSNLYISFNHSQACDENDLNLSVITGNVLFAQQQGYNLTYQYSYDNETFYNLTITNNQFIINQAFKIPLYFKILNGNNVILTTTYSDYYEDINETKINIIQDPKYDNNGIKLIDITFDFSNFVDYKIYYENMYFYVENDLVDSTNKKAYTLSNENYEQNLIKRFYVYIDNYCVYEGRWDFWSGDTTNNGGGGGRFTDFDTRFNEVVNENNNNDLDNLNIVNVEDIFNFIKKVLNGSKYVITVFFRLIFGFFNQLNARFRAQVITVFMFIVCTKIVKGLMK